ncbi:MAG: hypothetical protein ACOYEV_04210 [Candidatus Nanopelagicales bacterium]
MPFRPRIAVVLCASVSLVVLGPVPAQAADPTVDCVPRVPAVDLSVARQIYDEAASLGASAKVLLAGIEAALVESNLNNCADGDKDSAGAFQQRTSWGTYEQRTTVAYAAQAFYTRAIARESKYATAGQLAQAVQGSAYPSRYNAREAQASAIIAGLGSGPLVPSAASPSATATPIGAASPSATSTASPAATNASPTTTASPTPTASANVSVSPSQAPASPQVTAAPAAVRVTKITYPGRRTAVVSWISAAEASSYQVRVSLKNTARKWMAWHTKSATSVRLTGLQKRATYRVQIRPTGTGGAGPVVTVKFQQKR